MLIARRLLLSLWILLFSLHAIRVVPHLVDVSGDSKSLDGRQIRLLELNVNTQNGDPALVSKAINKLFPDIIGLLEVDETWISKLSLDAMYPYSRSVPRTDNFGIALYSKYPFEGELITSIGDNLPPVIVGRVNINGVFLDVVVVHSLPPISQNAFNTSWLLLRRLSAIVREKDGPLVVLGDLNSAPWAPLYNMFSFVGRLKSVANGNGVFFTWNALSSYLKFPIDHIFYKGDIQVGEVALGEFTGSDHYPLLAVLDLSSPLISSQIASSSVSE